MFQLLRQARTTTLTWPYDMYRDDEFNRDEYFYDGLGYRDELPPPGCSETVVYSKDWDNVTRVKDDSFSCPVTWA